MLSASPLSSEPGGAPSCRAGCGHTQGSGSGLKRPRRTWKGPKWEIGEVPSPHPLGNRQHNSSGDRAGTWEKLRLREVEQLLRGPQLGSEGPLDLEPVLFPAPGASLWGRSQSQEEAGPPPPPLSLTGLPARQQPATVSLCLQGPRQESRPLCKASAAPRDLGHPLHRGGH